MKTKLIFILLFGLSCLWTNAQILVNNEPVGQTVADKSNQKTIAKTKTEQKAKDLKATKLEAKQLKAERQKAAKLEAKQLKAARLKGKQSIAEQPKVKQSKVKPSNFGKPNVEQPIAEKLSVEQPKTERLKAEQPKTERLNTDPVDGKKKTKKSKTEEVYGKLGYTAYVENISDDAAKNKVASFKLNHYKKLANSYRLTGDTKNAESAYEKVLESDESPIYYLYYAQALQSNKKYSEAKDAFLSYHNKLSSAGTPNEYNSERYNYSLDNDARGEVLAEACDRVANFKVNQRIKLKNVKELNGGRLDFSPSYYQKGIVFVSNRTEGNDPNHVDRWFNTEFMNLYFADKDGDSFGEPMAFEGEVNTQFHEGPVTFTNNGQRMYFTRNNFYKGKKGKDKKDIIRLKVYSADLVGNSWGNIKELPFNSEEYSVCHPTLSADGSRLYFASEAPDGFGGLDIYVSENKAGIWTAPKNMGENVNTAGNELFPFIHDDGTLYFASNGHAGLGGLDIFSTVRTDNGEDEEEAWDLVQNVGKPFNSSVDDFGLILDITGTSGFLTSRREGGYGEDDIYSFIVPNGLRAPEGIPICVFDKATDQPISEAKLTVDESIDGKIMNKQTGELLLKLLPSEEVKDEYTIKLKSAASQQLARFAENGYDSDGEGLIDYMAFGDDAYYVTASKDGYKFSEMELSSYNIRALGDVDKCIAIPMEKLPPAPPEENCNKFTGVVKNKEYKNPVNKATVTFINRCNGEKVEVLTDETGQFDFCYECDCDYVLTGDKENFIGDKKPRSTFKIRCGEPLNETLWLTPAIDKNGNALADMDPDKLAPGSVIELRNIFYDFDQDYIREDAKPDLEELIGLLTKYPSMKISIGSHTDARASDSYNEDLSQRRAQSAVDYLLSRGIRSNRLEAKGYGETRVRNKCKNDIWCDEYEHQRNRRTEFTIISFDKPQNLDVKYDDNTPKTVDPKLNNKKW